MITPLRLAALTAGGAAVMACLAAAPPAVADTGSGPAAPVAASSDSDDDYPCPFVAAPGYLEGSGGNSQVIQDDDRAYMGCGNGPIILLERVDGDTVTFSLHGDRVRVREGATERLGPYRVHVVDVRGQRVELELSDPD